MKKILFISVILALVCFNALNAQPAVKDKSDSTKYTIDNCVNEFSIDRTEKTQAGYQYWFADKSFADRKTLKLSVVEPHNATHALHSHPEDEFFFILKGKAEFYLNGKTKIVGPNTSLYCPSYSEHGIRNVGDTELKYLVIKKYPEGR